MSARETQESRTATPPDERFWRRYSERHELPLAGATSIFAHALVLGVLILAGILMASRWHDERRQPPSMDVVLMEGAGGGGSPDAGDGGVGGPPGGKTEIGSEIKKDSPPPSGEFADLKAIPKVVVAEAAPNVVAETPDDTETIAALQRLTEDLDAEKKKNAAKDPVEPPKMPGVNYSKNAGKVGLNAGGTGVGGTGTGKKGGAPGVGDGTGTGFANGRPLAKQDIFAQRWRFDLTGDGKEHAAKLAAIGVTLAIPGKNGEILVVRDLKRRPALAKSEKLRDFKDAVKWYNQRPESILGLAKELQLNFVPNMVVMLLPKDREEKMAAEEARFAQEQGRPLQAIRATWFDFQLRDGAYEPVAIKIE